jgi:hypothetical protein
MKQKKKKKRGLGVWLKWQSTCLTSASTNHSTVKKGKRKSDENLPPYLPKEINNSDSNTNVLESAFGSIIHCVTSDDLINSVLQFPQVK